MIYQKLFVTERKIKERMKTDKKKLKALNRIKNLLGQLDNNIEIIPATDEKKIQAILSQLKEADLSKYEEIVVHEMAEGKELYLQC